MHCFIWFLMPDSSSLQRVLLPSPKIFNNFKQTLTSRCVSSNSRSRALIGPAHRWKPGPETRLRPYGRPRSQGHRGQPNLREFSSKRWTARNRLVKPTHTQNIFQRHVRAVVNKMKLKVIQSCGTLCDPMDYIINGILQARILEWVTFPRGSSQPRD